MKQMEVTIMGQSYLLGCPEGGEAALAKAVDKVDREMCAIRDAGRVRARERIAVLAALNLAYQLVEPVAPNKPAPSRSEAEPGGEAVPDLAALVRRLDEALAQDGQLL
ncbi:cell division protein ZapA [Paucibacter sp. APW11]|uniref:Cell division protein ZapA n=1 Tax=Roseateles aquae TaxID=3077235 RepID=A0ABU3P5I8_9BURK|nr:cell division protein ZapA [Paucibacter sp. APW11]MDT8997846.1 cell division protein ZapA [Paucibacter sp. APW11]